MRLVAPESRYEIDDGRVVYVSPSDEPHGSRHSKVSALLEACVAADWDVASDMLTRTSELGDIAPDASVFPRERDLETGGRQLEELAFEVASTESLSDAGRKAHKLATRGVRRIFAIDVARARAFEWSRDLGTWQILADDGIIEDRCLAAPLAVAALVRAAKADDAMAAALLAKKNAVLQAALDESRQGGRLEGKAEGIAQSIVAVLDARGIALSDPARTRILHTRDLELLNAWLMRAATCESADELVEIP
jgi:Uma2 family endonuclease